MSNQKIDLFSESFGSKKNPAVLLNAGAGGQSVSWPDIICKKLADRGYYVIRYDYRDTGLSSPINYEANPYNALDLAKDAINILKHYRFQQAHCVGFSMGGQIAQIMAAHFPEALNSIVLIGTSSDFKPGFDAFEGVLNPDQLSPPDPEYVKFATRKVDPASQTLDERLADYVETCRILDGCPEHFDAAFFRAKGLRNISRTTLQNPYLNHAKSMKASFELHQNALEKIQAPTLILQGKKDPVFAIDHGQDLAQRIKNSKLIIWEDFAHALSPQHFDLIVETLDEFFKKIINEKPLKKTTM